MSSTGFDADYLGKEIEILEDIKEICGENGFNYYLLGISIDFYFLGLSYVIRIRYNEHNTIIQINTPSNKENEKYFISTDLVPFLEEIKRIEIIKKLSGLGEQYE